MLTSNGSPGPSTLHADGRTLPFRNPQGYAESAGDTVLFGSGRLDWWTVRDGRKVALPYLAGQQLPVLSPDGTEILTVRDVTPTTARIAAYDLRTDAELGSVDVAKRSGDASADPEPGFDGCGAVYWASSQDGTIPSGPYGMMEWRPGADPAPTPIIRAGTRLFGISPAGPIRIPGSATPGSALKHYPMSGHEVLWAPLADGTYGPTAIRLPTTHDEQFEEWSPDGRLVTYSDGWRYTADGHRHRVGTPTLLDVTTGRTISLGLPADSTGAGWVAFEDPTHVLLFTSAASHPRRELLVRCPTDGGACERVPTPASSRYIEFLTQDGTPYGPDLEGAGH